MGAPGFKISRGGQPDFWGGREVGITGISNTPGSNLNCSRILTNIYELTRRVNVSRLVDIVR